MNDTPPLNLPDPASLSSAERCDLLRQYATRHREAAANKTPGPSPEEMKHALALIALERQAGAQRTKGVAKAPTRPVSLDDFV